jgi:uncharacterized membrane protein YagU involved in acid resistance
MSTNVSSQPSAGILTGAGAGLVAGIVMALVAMMATAIMGKGPFAPPAMIAAIVLGPAAMMTPSVGVIVIGLVLHMILSMMFGVVFVLIASRIATSTILLGAAYGIVLWIVNFYGLSFVSSGARAMVANEPIMLAVLTHLVFGIVLGAIVGRYAVRTRRSTLGA